jgi:hypothetical protein
MLKDGEIAGGDVAVAGGRRRLGHENSGGVEG